MVRFIFGCLDGRKCTGAYDAMTHALRHWYAVAENLQQAVEKDAGILPMLGITGGELRQSILALAIMLQIEHSLFEKALIPPTSDAVALFVALTQFQYRVHQDGGWSAAGDCANNRC